jgi:hypothetical protein
VTWLGPFFDYAEPPGFPPSQHAELEGVHSAIPFPDMVGRIGFTLQSVPTPVLLGPLWALIPGMPAAAIYRRVDSDESGGWEHSAAGSQERRRAVHRI